MFGMMRGGGRKKQSERIMANNKLPKGAYHMDRRLVPRVKEYLNHFRKGYTPDIEDLVSHLQTRYHEYSRRKQRAFKVSVEKAYEAITKQRAEDKHLEELEERFLHRRKNSPDFGDLKDSDDENDDDDDSDDDDEKGSPKSLELSSDSELSLGDEPLTEVQDTNMMNQSLQSMYKVTGSQQNSEDEKDVGQAKDTAKPSQEMMDRDVSVQASEPQIVGENHTPVLDTSGSAKTTEFGETHVPAESQPGAPNVESSPNNISNIGVKRKRPSIAVVRKMTPTSRTPTSRLSKKRQRVSQTGPDNTSGKEKPLGDHDFALVQSSLKFSDIGGCDQTLEQVCKLLVHMRHPEVFQTLGVTPPRGFLLHGPPGCGKTLLAHAIAGELEMPFIKLAATEIVSGVSGESEEKVRDLFARAVAHSPCVLFLDEIDSITPKRETASKDMERRIVSQLLTCMDDLNSNPDAHVLVIGATNRPDSLDPALRRAGRFDREISMGIPDEKARERILQVLCQKLKLEKDLSFAVLSRLAPGFVGADLMALTREAALVAVNRIFQELQKNTSNECGDGNIEKGADEGTVSGKVKGNEDTNRMTGTFSVTEWLKEQSPLTAEDLEKLCISLDDFKEALTIVQPSAKREGFATIPDVTWEDVGALKDVREELSMAILAPVKYPAEFKVLGLTHPPGILLAGPPGCGKTLLAKAIANESGINFISVKGPELLNMYVGESERAVRQVFQRARNSAPCVIFFDELDALCPRRSGGAESGASVRVVNQLLTEMDGVVARKQVFIMGATNRPDIIDPAVMRPGRLDKVLYVGLPTSEDRQDILRTLTKDGQKPHLLPDVCIKDLARDERCHGLSGADLAALVREACMAALRECINVHSSCNPSLDSQVPVTQSPAGVGQRHFDAAFKKVKPSVSQKDQLLYEQMKNLSTKV